MLGDSPDHPGTDLEAPVHGRDRNQRFLWCVKAGGGRLPTVPGDDPGAKGKAAAKRGDFHCAGLPCPTDHVGWRPWHRDGEGLNMKHAAPTRPMRGQELLWALGGRIRTLGGRTWNPIYWVRANNITGPRCRGPSI